MSIDHEDCAERQARLDWMIDEFRKAQMRRRVKATDKTVEPSGESDSTGPATGSATSQ
jgi:hypothetical protein